MDNKRTFSPGDHVIFNGVYPGTVIRYYSEGMIEIQGERGMVCIPEEDARPEPRVRYYLTYRNQGKPERTPARYDNDTDACACAAFLKFQGATAVRVHQEK